MGIIIRQSIKGTIVNYVGTLIGFVTTFFVLTRFLTAEEIGLTRVLIDAATLFVGLAQLGTNSSIIRFFPYFRTKESGDNGFFFWTLIVPLIGFVVFASLFCLFKASVSELFYDKSPLFVEYYYVVLPIAFFMLYQTVLATNANVLMRIVVPKLVSEVGVRLFSLVSYLLYALEVIDLDWFVISFCGVYGLAALCNLIYLFLMGAISFKPNLKFVTKPLLKNYLSYTFFLMAAAVGTMLTPSISTFFVSAQLGLEFTGIFAIATYIATMVSIPYRSLGSIVQLQISQTIKENQLSQTNQLIKSVSLHQLLIGSFIFLTIWINIDLIFRILPNGELYATAKWVVLWLGLGQLLISTLSVTISVLNYSKYYYFALIFTFALTFFAILFNTLLIPRLEMNGSALASLLANLLYFLGLLVLLWIKTQSTPLSKQQLKVVVVMLLLMGLNQFWVHFLTPSMSSILSDSLLGAIAEGAVRTLFLLLVGGYICYRWQISLELNRLLKEFVLRK